MLPYKLEPNSLPVTSRLPYQHTIPCKILRWIAHAYDYNSTGIKGKTPSLGKPASGPGSAFCGFEPELKLSSRPVLRLLLTPFLRNGGLVAGFQA